MVMIGTASHHPSLPPQYSQSPITSDLTNEEMWNMVNMGYVPIQLVLGVSVYSLGLVGGITAAFKSLGRAKIAQDAQACGADDVVGIKTNVYQLGGGIIEFMAIGTAVKRMPGITTISPILPPQAIIRDKDTFINTAETALGSNLNQGGGRTGGMSGVGS